ncbi:DUF6247 family protein [Streptomyces violaceusniger]|uniref:DUF6247 family protein n=1 Tax=Streptomyces violaceusniger TaxID=68280 RepID=UPI0009967F4F|nr:DUF6247 family protein [Streptomyces hygroscopicus]AQW51183.1 hypothetical protein SHXM_04646 [Streptomyces hygroscopicus]
MSSQPDHPHVPVIPQPPMTRDALREAVKRLDLARIAEFDRELGEAFDRAVQTASTTPMRLFLEKWATVVAIERHPGRFHAMREAERVTGDPQATEEEFRSAQQTITRILREASAEAGAAG